MEEASARERKRPREGDASEDGARMREVWKRLLEAAAGKPQYTYLPIADTLKVPGVRVCLFAVVAEIGAAVRSRGTGEPHSQPLPSSPSAHPPSPHLRV
jgi:hypothetical protein